MRPKGPRDKDGLTRRGREYADLMLAGKSTSEIARQLNVELRTVESTTYKIKATLGIAPKKRKPYKKRRDEFGLTRMLRIYADLIIHGHTYQEIADELGVSINAVRSATGPIRETLGVKNDVGVCRVMLLGELIDRKENL